MDIKWPGSLSQVVLTGTSIKAVSAVKELVYKGACHLDEVILSQVAAFNGLNSAHPA